MAKLDRDPPELPTASAEACLAAVQEALTATDGSDVTGALVRLLDAVDAFRRCADRGARFTTDTTRG